MMKNVAIIGTSRYVGSILLQEALGRNLYVKAIVRHPGKRITKVSKATEVQK